MFPVSISVVMPTYNTEIPMLKEAVESIMNQTFRDFEFIIIDDCSTNDFPEYLKSLQDDRIRIIWNPVHIGITKTLNVGLEAARGKYIARMDADDISLPERLEKQYAYMESHPDVILSGTDFQMFGDQQRVSHVNINDLDVYRIKLIFGNPGPSHPTIIMNHSIMDQFHLRYNENLTYCQDYGLFTSVIQHGRIANLNEILVMQRSHKKQISTAKRTIQIQCDKVIQKQLLSELIENVSEAELDCHYRWAYEKKKESFPDAVNCLRWYLRLIRANMQKGKYNKPKFIRFVIRNYFQLLLPEAMVSKVYSAVQWVKPKHN